MADGRLQLWAIGVVRNEADILAINVRHHLHQGVDQFLILDNDSTDGTDALLEELARTAPVEWRRHRGHFRQDELLTSLVRQAFARGADWVLPLDADEFWHAPGSTIRAVLEDTTADALRVQLVNFVQRRDQESSSADALLTMTRRTAQPMGTVEEIASLVSDQKIAFVEHLYAPKWIAHASARLEVGWGNHTLHGAGDQIVDTDKIVCLHAPLRSKAVLAQKVDADRPLTDVAEYLEQAWHVRRWRQLAADGRLDEEWSANSYLDDSLDLFGTPRPVIPDFRLRDLVAPWMSTPQTDTDGRIQGAVPQEASASECDDAAVDQSPFAPSQDVRIWGISAVCNVSDVLRVHALHHLSLGIEKLLIVDMGSSDGTEQVLEELATDSRLEWHRRSDGQRRSEALHDLAREAWRRGATWVLPLEADEFLSTEPEILSSILKGSTAGVLACPVVTFVQRRDVTDSSPQSLLHMTQRCKVTRGPYQHAQQMADVGGVSVVEVGRRAKWLCRAGPTLTFDRSGHPSGGISGDVERAPALACLRAPLRAKAQLLALARLVSEMNAGDEAEVPWELQRWGRLHRDGGLESEWSANTVHAGHLGDGGLGRALVEDDRLRQIAERWLSDGLPKRTSIVARSPIPSQHVTPLSVDEREAILDRMRSVTGWLTDAEGELLIHAVEQVASRLGPVPCIVEVGSYCGRSTVVLGSAVRRLGVEQRIYAVDPHLGEVGAFDSQIGVSVAHSTVSAFEKNLSDAGLVDTVTLLRRHSFEVEWVSPIGLLFIDGLHDMASVEADTIHFLTSVVPGGLVAFHDYSELFPGVTTVVNRLVADGVLREYQRRDALIVLERTASALGQWGIAQPDPVITSGGDLPTAFPQDPASLHQWIAESTDAELATLRARVHRYSALERALRRELRRHRSSLAAMSRDSAQLRARVAAAADERAGLRRQIEGVQRTLTDSVEGGRRFRTQLQEVRRRLASKDAEVDALASELSRQLTGFHDELTNRQNELRALHESWSWRATAPLRLLLDVVRRWKPVQAPLLQEAATPVPEPEPLPSAPILVISDQLPTPDQDCGSYRMFQILKQFVSLGYTVTFCSDADDGEERYEADLRRENIEVIRGFGPTIEHLERAGHRYRQVLLCRPLVAFRYLFAVRALLNDAKVVYDTVDLHWLRMQRQAEISGDAEVAQLAQEYERIERFNAESSDLTLTVTDDEKRVILENDPHLHVAVLPNVHPPVAAGGRWETREGLIFVGSFWHKPNEDAVVFFVDEILPLIHRSLPGVVFNIVGSHMSPVVEALASECVRCIGHVPDLQPYFDSARVCVAPLRFGAGMKGKVGDSMRRGVPVVSTAVGAEGLMLVDGDNARIADTPAQFADAVVALYSDRALWTSVATSGAAHIDRHFGGSAARRRMEAIFSAPVLTAPVPAPVRMSRGGTWLEG